MPKSSRWKVLSSRPLLDVSPFRQVRVETVELPDGRQIPDYYQLDMLSFVCIFPETEEGRIIVFRQYRHGSRRMEMVFPGGHLKLAKRRWMRRDGSYWKKPDAKPAFGRISAASSSTPTKAARSPTCFMRRAAAASQRRSRMIWKRRRAYF